MDKLYIAGPMTGEPNQNREAFIHAGEVMQGVKQWDIIFNPIYSMSTRLKKEGNVSVEKAYRLCMSEDLQFICEQATHIYMLRGWQNSPGARAEHETAICLGLHIMYE